MATLSEQAAPKKRFEFGVAKQITRETIKLASNVAYYFRIEGEMKVAPEDDDVKTLRKRKPKVAEDGKPQELPPIIMDVIELEMVEKATICVPVVLESELRKAYGDDYIGKDLMIIKIPIEGKRYFKWNIREITLPPEHPLYGVTVDGEVIETAENPPVENSNKKAKKS